MSKNQDATPAAADKAFETLYRGVTERVFFAKLANAHGIVPQTADQADKLLGIGQRLLEIEAQETAKAASAQSDALGMILADLDQELSWSPDAQDLQGAKAAAAMFAQDPQILAAAAAMTAS